MAIQSIGIREPGLRCGDIQRAADVIEDPVTWVWLGFSHAATQPGFCIHWNQRRVTNSCAVQEGALSLRSWMSFFLHFTVPP